MHGVSALPPDSPQVAQPPQPPQHKPSPNNNVLPPKPAHLAAQAAAASSFRQKKPPMPSPPLSSPPTSKVDQEVRYRKIHSPFPTTTKQTKNEFNSNQTIHQYPLLLLDLPPTIFYFVSSNLCKYVYSINQGFVCFRVWFWHFR